MGQSPKGLPYELDLLGRFLAPSLALEYPGNLPDSLPRWNTCLHLSSFRLTINEDTDGVLKILSKSTNQKAQQHLLYQKRVVKEILCCYLPLSFLIFPLAQPLFSLIPNYWEHGTGELFSKEPNGIFHGLKFYTIRISDCKVWFF